MVNVLKFQHLQRKGGLLGLKFAECLSEQQTGNALIRLPLKKQSDLGLHSLSRPFGLATIVQNFITFTILYRVFTIYELLISS